MPLGPQILTYGNVPSTFLLTVKLTPVSTATITTAEQSFTVPGLQVGDQVSDLSLISGAFPNTLLTIANIRISAANTLTIAFTNTTAGPLSYPTGTYYIEINRPDPAFPMTVIQ